MRFSEDDHDIGTIVSTVVITLVVGALVYAYNSRSTIIAAYIPSIERTVPNIVPSQPGM